MHPLFDVAIVGAGASGVLLRAQLQRQSPGLRSILIGSGPVGRGLAYATQSSEHLLNVPARNMSALPDQNDHFLDWLRQRQPGADAMTFATRAQYGEYLASLLAADTPTAEVRQDRVIILRKTAADFALVLASGVELRARSVALALGHFAPADPHPCCREAGAAYFADPWQLEALQGLATDAPVLLIGTGLTMVDLVLALREQGHQGPIHALSRHGLRPRVHAATGGFVPTRPVPTGSVLAMLCWLREQIVLADAAGSGWRAVIDSLRPHTARLWQNLVPAERDRFLRHARALWDVHRHRLAPSQASRFDRLLADGGVSIHAGRLLAVSSERQLLRVDWRPRYRALPQRLTVARMINCTGTTGDYAGSPDPLITDLRQRGLIRPDRLGLGIASDAEGRLFGSQGGLVAQFYTLGPARRPELWESTAIPELREQAARLATCITSDLGHRARVD